MPVSSSPCRWRRPAALLVTPALACALVAVPAPTYAAVDPTPVSQAADFIAGQLVDGRVPDTYFDATVEAGLALLAAGGHSAEVAGVSDFLAREIDVYVVGEGLLSEQFNPGEAARTAVFVRATGGDVSDFGGRDLVDDVVSHVNAQGRVVGSYNYRPSSKNTDQAYGVQALAAAASPKTKLATDFLVGLQCPGGYWLDGAGGGSDDSYPTCPAISGGDGVTDVTALAVLSLASQADDPAVRSAIDEGVAWLLRIQASDGSFPRTDTSTHPAGAEPDVASTGRAAGALRSVGQVEAAEAAARWLRGRQVAGGQITGAGVADVNGSWARSTSAALQGLLATPARAEPRVIHPAAGFVRARSLQDVVVEGLAPGQEIRVTGPSKPRVVTADAEGRAVASVRLPRASGRHDYSVSLGESVLGIVFFDALAATALDATTTRDTVRATRTQRVVVEGLSAGESVRVKYRGRFVAHATVGADGRFTTTFRVGKNAGQRRVRVLGEFRNRSAVERFVVTKR